MDNQTLARWHGVCTQLRGPFRYAEVSVSKLTRSATLTLRTPDGVPLSALSGIGADSADYKQIGEDIIAVAREHGLLNHMSETSVVDKDTENQQ
jgi:hypothetical protein